MKQYSFLDEGWKSKHLGTMSTQAVNKVRAAGMIPTAKQYADGINRGTDQLAKKIGKQLGSKMAVRKAHDLTKIMAIGGVGFKKGDTSYRFLPKNADHAAALVHPFRRSNNPLNAISPYKLPVFKGNRDLLNATLRRHETDELGAIAKSISKGSNVSQYNKGIKSALSAGKLQQASAIPGEMSSHFPGVLAKEKRIGDITKNAYGTGIYRSPEEMGKRFNTSDPKQLRSISRDFHKYNSQLDKKPKQKTLLRKQVDAIKPEMIKQTVGLLSSPGSIFD